MSIQVLLVLVLAQLSGLVYKVLTKHEVCIEQRIILNLIQSVCVCVCLSLSLSISIFVFFVFTELLYIYAHASAQLLHGIRARGLKSSAADKKSLRQNSVEQYGQRYGKLATN